MSEPTYLHCCRVQRRKSTLYARFVQFFQCTDPSHLHQSTLSVYLAGAIVIYELMVSSLQAHVPSNGGKIQHHLHIACFESSVPHPDSALVPRYYHR